MFNLFVYNISRNKDTKKILKKNIKIKKIIFYCKKHKNSALCKKKPHTAYLDV